jgi:hypothetical protein
MSEFIDLKDKIFSRLTVLDKTRRDEYSRWYWLVHCECGNEFETLGNALKSGNTKSCGCLRAELVSANNTARALPRGESCFNMLFKNYKNEAERRSLAFELTEEQFRDLTKGSCYYCGAPPSQKIEFKGRNGAYEYNGLDRLINEIGYTTSNSVSCCGPCNMMKHVKSVEDFLTHCKKVTEHQQRKNDPTPLNSHCCR